MTTTARPMPFARAATLAIEALCRERKVFAPERNMHRAGISSPATERAARRYTELTEAIETLSELGKARVHD